ncbi:SAM-dependent methyltransferase [Leuconostoc gelidum subsp. gelidum]|uniref:SAM-dependent methyltransferase n=1 Tax=Leuconostoc gelidum subsp. gelidum TaxID=1607839 RepID=A0AB35FZI4_LEUGE|nr:class I SAM-dependent methyltransferase [Leuconostoc gelidum]MBZ5963522.1 SAM-dependent methyltransferase [Leuconostoc gelidum subsp. gelidum]MBZ5975636.1 SAM-dependent methyltransferase [Leuconostoc gelidum subsp. gelidum]MBZ5976196.1 SAM-dependent methyltransferase [Leuconostoc gelidum subsp. gelidum]MBZ5986979.1 SAM-dependent methyltransferase [Leuconostoc gelidum subsp. gelidum]MBZ6000097.1 SAM-dependent methyltransferase [Leuconostoc gelidum subsp. gelidum]
MDSIHLSPRLNAVADFVPLNARLADIGSDHAYLPVNLLLNDKISHAIVGEVAKGPLDNAHHELKKRHLLERADVRLASGLAAINDTDNVDTVTIAGMGGILISNILNAGKQQEKTFKTLVLQPNTDEQIVRRWLTTQHYQIIDETIVQEESHFYEIIAAVVGEQQLSDLDLIFGPYLRVEKTATFVAKWQKESERIALIFKQLQAAGKSDTDTYRQWQLRYNQIQAVIS